METNEKKFSTDTRWSRHSREWSTCTSELFMDIMHETPKALVASGGCVGDLGNASRVDTGAMYIGMVDLGRV